MDPAGVALRETHIEWVFLVGDRAYKRKKSIGLSFIDYRTQERRYEMLRSCDRRWPRVRA